VIETFPHLTPDDVTLILARATRTTYGPGEQIIAEGARREAIFILRSGSALVQKDHLGSPVPVAMLGPGELIGEISFVDHSTASASVLAAETSEVDVLEGPEVQALLASNPGLATRFYSSLAVTLAHRLRATSGMVLPVFGAS
jgi:CRP-like cAMP-binding protein